MIPCIPPKVWKNMLTELTSAGFPYSVPSGNWTGGERAKPSGTQKQRA